MFLDMLSPMRGIIKEELAQMSENKNQTQLRKDKIMTTEQEVPTDSDFVQEPETQPEQAQQQALPDPPPDSKTAPPIPEKEDEKETETKETQFLEVDEQRQSIVPMPRVTLHTVVTHPNTSWVSITMRGVSPKDAHDMMFEEIQRLSAKGFTHGNQQATQQSSGPVPVPPQPVASTPSYPTPQSAAATTPSPPSSSDMRGCNQISWISVDVSQKGNPKTSFHCKEPSNALKYPIVNGLPPQAIAAMFKPSLNWLPSHFETPGVSYAKEQIGTLYLYWKKEGKYYNHVYVSDNPNEPDTIYDFQPDYSFG